jgi:putative transposase
MAQVTYPCYWQKNSPAAHPWCRYCANARGERSVLIAPHRRTWRSVPTPPSVRRPTRGLFSARRDREVLRDLCSALQTGTPLGNARFQLRIEQAPGVRVGYSRRGRPRNPVPHPGKR